MKIIRNAIFLVLVGCLSIIGYSKHIEWKWNETYEELKTRVYSFKPIKPELALQKVTSLPEVVEYRKLVNQSKFSSLHIAFEDINNSDSEDKTWSIHVFEEFPDRIVTFNWYKVDKKTGEVVDKMFVYPSGEAGVVLGTTQIDFLPNDINAEEANGECWGSIASKSSTAHRCSVGNTIYDPCFKVAEKKVACYSDPEEAPLIVVTVQDALADSVWSDQRSWLSFAKDSDTFPWFVILENGSKCQIMTGTAVTINQVNYYFNCLYETDNIYGEINTNVTPWQMKLVDYLGNKEDEYLNIVKVYR